MAKVAISNSKKVAAISNAPKAAASAREATAKSVATAIVKANSSARAANSSHKRHAKQKSISHAKTEVSHTSHRNDKARTDDRTTTAEKVEATAAQTIENRKVMTDVRRKIREVITVVSSSKALKSRAVGLCCLFASIMVCLGACSPKHSSYSEFSDVPAAGWTHNSPLYFTPQYGDSAACYDISVAIRHDQDYAYRNLSITADFIGENQKLKRRIINVELADKYGTWKGSGFGALYQFKQVVLEQVPAHTVKRIVLWQTMSDRDTVGNITDVGIIVSPSEVQ